MPSTAATVAIAAAVVAGSSASHSRRSAETAYCKDYLYSYDAKAASIGEARQYAACVHRIYGDGEPMSAGMVLFIKAIILAAVLGASFGVWLVWRGHDHWTQLFDYILAGILGMILGAITPLVIVGAYAALNFLVSA